MQDKSMSHHALSFLVMLGGNISTLMPKELIGS